jgi:membrane protease YdiL (CAAX protease family)
MPFSGMRLFCGDRMTSFPPAPQTPPDNIPVEFPFSAYSARRVRMENALQNGRLLSALLAIVLVGIVARTLWFSRETPYARAVSELYENSQAALRSTKVAYSPALITGTPPYLSTPPGKQAADLPGKSEHPALSPLSGNTVSQSTAFRPETFQPSKQRAKRRRSPVSFTAAEASSNEVGVRAVKDWKELVGSKYARAAEWRRLGIVLALFRRPGALEALAHVDDNFAPLPGSTPYSRRRTASLRDVMQHGAQQSDPFGHSAMGVSSAQEKVTWNALYGPQPISAAQLPALRQNLQNLHLGWFQNIAVAQLYWKAGMKVDAEHAAQAADTSAQQTRTLESLQINIAKNGFFAAIISGFVAFLRWAGMKRPGSPTQNPALKIRSPAALFPQMALLFAFLIYLVSHVAIGLMLSYVLRPFAAHFENWSASALLRMEFALQIGAYVPICLLPLLVLCKRVPFDPLTGKRMRLRTLLVRLGYYIHNVCVEVGAGAWGYVLLMPGYVIVSLISHALFHRFHTPVNPAQFETMSAILPLDKALVFLTAAVAAPIVEETMFRGLLYSALRTRMGVAGAAMLSAAIFALVHPTLPGGFLPIWAIGVALALVYERRGSLLPGMVLHGIHNGLIVFMGFAVFGR